MTSDGRHDRVKVFQEPICQASEAQHRSCAQNDIGHENAARARSHCGWSQFFHAACARYLYLATTALILASAAAFSAGEAFASFASTIAFLRTLESYTRKS